MKLKDRTKSIVFGAIGGTIGSIIVLLIKSC